jgi:hypothetical protein
MRLLATQYYGCCVVDLFNGHRTHAGLGGLTPAPRAGEDSARANVSTYRWQPHCRGLYQTPNADRGMTAWTTPAQGHVRTSRVVDRLNTTRVLVPD